MELGVELNNPYKSLELKIFDDSVIFYLQIKEIRIPVVILVYFSLEVLRIFQGKPAIFETTWSSATMNGEIPIDFKELQIVAYFFRRYVRNVWLGEVQESTEMETYALNVFI